MVLILCKESTTTMTTERELAEWPEKIRRVRGQAAPRKSNHYGRSRSNKGIWLRVILFVGGLSLALAVSNNLKQQEVPETRPQIVQPNRR